MSGYSLILVKEFDEVVRNFSAHVNAFLKPVAFVPFNSVTDALHNVQCINESIVSPLLATFLRQNLPVKDAVLGVADHSLGEAIWYGILLIIFLITANLIDKTFISVL